MADLESRSTNGVRELRGLLVALKATSTKNCVVARHRAESAQKFMVPLKAYI